MAKTYDAIDAKLRTFIDDQKMFFVATAPLTPDGHINVSPKGLAGTFAIIDDRTIAYLDLTGSGVETIAHLRDNGRICVMFCAFEGRPRIVRIHGTGDVVEPDNAEFESLSAHFDEYPGVRSIIRVRAGRISDSCGYGVPLYEHTGGRDQLQRWAEQKGEDGLAQYRRDNNAESLDGLRSLLRDH
ncbi:MAG: pyridoxamine 5'-phosphate oxidase family protein [Deltaproteobacteria bacterium]|nr:pyridoxamine 5'-phosphate oxidase family protein [Deltaproteobacteria bacterium]MBW1875277.1 pyridoxamine 5'-phosphate oxidase family protein [Deltaproteobacteria bacterium]MBW2211291.1 pyridoxamine 5'-phosphate oxidase family protein [Deltaproteobacteria bacterium]MBW2213836.1 pyridoxamine 5'-phosphate oxidase family protein [Deltaproteobacteria bacterium]MBW2378250.1 pyridoxamine 5'-phosphate oxidase family protein [Deltaproteobacteria bacterium]